MLRGLNNLIEFFFSSFSLCFALKPYTLYLIIRPIFSLLVSGQVRSKHHNTAILMVSGQWTEANFETSIQQPICAVVRDKNWIF